MNNDDALRVLFDADYYASQAQVTDDPLQHFLAGGWRKFDPHPLFSSSFYWAQNPDVMRADANPLLHWVGWGWRERRSFHELFDISYYLSQLDENSDVDVLRHFLAGGWRKFDPHPLFSSSYYLAKNPEVPDGPRSPLEHFLTIGGAKRLQHHPLFDPNNYQAQLGESAVPVIDFIRKGGVVDTSRHFNIEWYLTQSADARMSPDAPVVHWIKVGSKQGIPPTSHPFVTTLSDLLADDPVAGVLIADLEIPRPKAEDEVCILPFTTEVLDSSKELTCWDSEVYFSGDLPGIITKDGRMIGESSSHLIAVRHRFGRSILHGSRGLVAGIVTLPKVKSAIVALSSEHGETNWFLSVLPQIRSAAKKHPGALILTNCHDIRDYAKNLSQRFLGDNPIEFVSPGILREVQAAIPLTIVEDSPMSTEVITAAQEHFLRVLLIDEDDDLDAFAPNDLRDLTTSGGLTPLDLRWPADLVLSVLSEAKTVFASRALAVAASFTAPSTEIIASEGNGAYTDLGTMGRNEVKEYLRNMEKKDRYPGFNPLVIRSLSER